MLISCPAYGHSGRTDSSGGHHDRKRGGYHYHSQSTQPYKPTFTFPRTSVKTAREKPRVSARRSARSAARPITRRGEPSAKKADPVKPKDTLEAKYKFHHSEHDPYLAVSFTDSDKSWRLYTPRANHIRLAKSKVVRIEPIDDVHGFRTWMDSTGRFSTVAKFHDLQEHQVKLEKLTGRLIRLPVERLSDVDKNFVRRAATN